jgi:hypothetical protein
MRCVSPSFCSFIAVRMRVSMAMQSSIQASSSSASAKVGSSPSRETAELGGGGRVMMAM